MTLTDFEQAHLDLIRDYFASIESGVSTRAFFTEDMLQIEFPNRLNPKGQRSDLVSLIQRSEMGKKVLTSQHYEIVSAIAQGNRAAVEAVWTGTLAIPFGALSAGSVMKAYFAIFFQFRDGKIALQHNYDCFEPW
ncbi:nuclear transport factor 2 family protein [Acidicapsa dinghuensis]|uniref:Nuclear transport factor 2 family protein n=1 Tax=Acidicapsa dinghuensis TaxID=2218256 RepID=A0ABW1EJZ5_9BACT|nr:nuclear transport factor 2 family protein [Acidicapsa dinghuensis]